MLFRSAVFACLMYAISSLIASHYAHAVKNSSSGSPVLDKTRSQSPSIMRDSMTNHRENIEDRTSPNTGQFPPAFGAQVPDNAAAVIGENSGEVWIVDENGNRRKAEAGDHVLDGETVETGEDSSAYLTFNDGMSATFGEDSAGKIGQSKYDYNYPEEATGTSFLRGVFQATSDLIGVKDESNVGVGGGCCGIRGTQYLVDLRDDKVSKMILIEGEVVERTADGKAVARTITTPYSILEIAKDGSGSRVVKSTREEVYAEYSSIFPGLIPANAFEQFMAEQKINRAEYTVTGKWQPWIDTRVNLTRNENIAFRSRREGVGVSLGADKVFTPELMGGISLAWDQSRTETKFVGSERGSLDSKSVSISPYIGFVVAKYVNLDASIGGAFVNYSQDDVRNNTSNIVTGDRTAQRLFGGLGASISKDVHQFTIRSRIGYSYMREWQSEFTESNSQGHNAEMNSVGTGSFGVTAKYNNSSYNPFVSVTYVKDFVQEDVHGIAGLSEPVVNDDNAVQVRIGISKSFANGMNLSLGAQKEFRREFENASASARISIPF